jgi:hypothetical protein
VRSSVFEDDDAPSREMVARARVLKAREEGGDRLCQDASSGTVVFEGRASSWAGERSLIARRDMAEFQLLEARREGSRNEVEGAGAAAAAAAAESRNGGRAARQEMPLNDDDDDDSLEVRPCSQPFRRSIADTAFSSISALLKLSLASPHVQCSERPAGRLRCCSRRRSSPLRLSERARRPAYFTSARTTTT